MHSITTKLVPPGGISLLMFLMHIECKQQVSGNLVLTVHRCNDHHSRREGNIVVIRINEAYPEVSTIGPIAGAAGDEESTSEGEELFEKFGTSTTLSGASLIFWLDY